METMEVMEIMKVMIVIEVKWLNIGKFSKKT
jgi:hypothetical protein